MSVQKALNMNGQMHEGRQLIVDFDCDSKKAGYKPNLNTEENSKFVDKIIKVVKKI